MTKLPLFSTINGVIFPNSNNCFTIGRAFSMASVREAYKNFEGKIVISTQKSITLSKPTIETVYKTACLCKITNLIELPDNTIRFSATGEDRFKIEVIQDQGDLRYATGEIMKIPSRSNETSPQKKEHLAKKLQGLNLDLEDEEYMQLNNLKSTADDYEFAMMLGRFVGMAQIKMRELTVEEMNKGLFVLDVLTDQEKKAVDQGMAYMQEILESNDLKASIQKMEKFLENTKPT